MPRTYSVPPSTKPSLPTNPAPTSLPLPTTSKSNQDKDKFEYTPSFGTSQHHFHKAYSAPMPVDRGLRARQIRRLYAHLIAEEPESRLIEKFTDAVLEAAEGLIERHGDEEVDGEAQWEPDWVKKVASLNSALNWIGKWDGEERVKEGKGKGKGQLKDQEKNKDKAQPKYKNQEKEKAVINTESLMEELSIADLSSDVDELAEEDEDDFIPPPRGSGRLSTTKPATTVNKDKTTTSKGKETASKNKQAGHKDNTTATKEKPPTQKPNKPTEKQPKPRKSARTSKRQLSAEEVQTMREEIVRNMPGPNDKFPDDYVEFLKEKRRLKKAGEVAE